MGRIAGHGQAGIRWVHVRAQMDERATLPPSRRDTLASTSGGHILRPACAACTTCRS